MPKNRYPDNHGHDFLCSNLMKLRKFLKTLFGKIQSFAGAFLGIPKLEQLEDDKGEPIGTRLIIRAVTDYNTGQYECTALNPFGQDKKTLHLNVPQI